MIYHPKVVGNKFRPALARQAFVDLEISDHVYLEREPSNSHDENAIKVITEDGEFVGYVQRDLAAVIAPLLDDDQDYLAEVERNEGDVVLEVEF